MKLQINKQAFNFVRKACSSDSHRPILTGMCIATYRGSVWLVATDTHRLHAHKLDAGDAVIPNDEKAQVLAVFNPKRIEFELKYYGGSDILLSVDEGKVTEFEIGAWEKRAKHDRRPSALNLTTAASRPEPLDGVYPPFDRILYDETVESVDRTICVNHKYLLDACVLSLSNANKVVIAPKDQGNNGGTTVFIKPNRNRHDMCDWFVVIMEMAS